MVSLYKPNGHSDDLNPTRSKSQSDGSGVMDSSTSSILERSQCQLTSRDDVTVREVRDGNMGNDGKWRGEWDPIADGISTVRVCRVAPMICNMRTIVSRVSVARVSICLPDLTLLRLLRFRITDIALLKIRRRYETVAGLSDVMLDSESIEIVRCST